MLYSLGYTALMLAVIFGLDWAFDLINGRSFDTKAILFRVGTVGILSTLFSIFMWWMNDAPYASVLFQQRENGKVPEIPDDILRG